MVVVQINQTYNIGSTGKIMFDLSSVIEHFENESYMVSGYTNDFSSSKLSCTNRQKAYYPIRKDQIIFRLSGINGYRYKKKTKEIIKWIDDKNPDIIHLHNIHGDWLHLETLFNYIREKNIPIVWTLHDCWAFTGRCSHFELCGCNKWKTGCYECKNKKVYPITYFFDHSSKMYADKKKWFTGLKNVTIVTPSQWLANYVKESFLGEYPIQVIHNGIDTSIFCPQETKSHYYNGIGNKKIILGVASSWSATKGFDDFIKLDKLLDHDKYQIVMVGLNLRQMKNIPSTIIGITRTNNQKELAELYSGADVFVNPTYQDNYPTTNLEAIACGTPVITYRTGGSPESIFDKCGLVFNKGDIESLYAFLENNTLHKINMELLDALNSYIDKNAKYKEYVKLYYRMVID